MVERNPRNMDDWMRSVERRLMSAAQGAARIPASYNEKLREDILADQLRHPTAPVEITSQTAIYTSDGLSREYARVLVDFPDVTKATDGTDIPIREYELWGRDDTTNYLEATTDAAAGLAAPGLTIPGLASTPVMVAKAAAALAPFKRMAVSTDSSLRVDGLVPGAIYTFKVRAIGQFTVDAGEFSPVFQVQMDEDTNPPPQPTVPRLTVSHGTIKVEWDGLAVTGAMPGDFSHLVVSWGQSSSPINEVQRFWRGGGIAVISGTDYYTPVFVRFQAVDLAGNRGPWSEQAVGFTVPLVDEDIILSEIDAAQTWLKNIDARTSILDGTIVTEHLVITEEMTAKIANFLKIRAGMIEANAIEADDIQAGAITSVKLETELALVTAIIAGNKNRAHAQIDQTGFRVFAGADDDGAPREVVRMGVQDTNDVFAVTDTNDIVVAQIDNTGTITGQSLRAEQTIFYKGTELQATLDALPRGIVAWRQFPRPGAGYTWPTLPSAGGEVGLFEIGWRTEDDIPARLYKVNVPKMLLKSLSGAASTIGLTMRFTDDGSAPTTSSQLITSDWGYASIGGYRSAGFNNQLVGSANGPYIRILISMWATGGCSIDAAGLPMISVEDAGLSVPQGGSYTTGGGTIASGVTPSAPPANPVVTRSVEYSPISGGIRSFLPNDAQYAYQVGKGYQGLSPSGYGNLRSMYAFPSVTSLLAGATVNDIWVWMYFEHWYNNAGGYAKIGLHPNSSIPATWNTNNTLQITSPLWPKASGRYVRLPDSTYAGFISGAWKGFTLLGDSSYNTYGITTSAKLKIRYTK